MRQAERTVQWWGVYVILVGALLVALPRWLLGLLGMEIEDVTWPRVSGVVAIALGTVYFVTPMKEAPQLPAASVIARWAAVVGFM